MTNYCIVTVAAQHLLTLPIVIVLLGSAPILTATIDGQIKSTRTVTWHARRLAGHQERRNSCIVDMSTF